MKSNDTATSPQEILLLDGHTVILRYADKSAPKVLESIQNTLFDQKITPTKSPIFCNQAENVR